MLYVVILRENFVTWICSLFSLWPGERSCLVDFHHAEESDDQALARYSNQSMIFEPALGGGDARCSCDTVDR